MKIEWKLATVTCVLGWCLMLATNAAGGIVNYGNIAGDNVLFETIVESSTRSGPLFGQPGAAATTLTAPGTGFLSQSAGGGIDLVDGRLQMTIQTINGYEFDSLDFGQLGSYFGFGQTARSLVHSFATIESNGISYSGGMTLDHTGAGQGGWSGNYSISFPSTDQVTLTLNSQLLTASGTCDAAFIDSSSIQIALSASPPAGVPEPSMAAIPLLALLGIAGFRIRRDG